LVQVWVGPPDYHPEFQPSLISPHPHNSPSRFVVFVCVLLVTLGGLTQEEVLSGFLSVFVSC
jgi:hypothetical protein